MHLFQGGGVTLVLIGTLVAAGDFQDRKPFSANPSSNDSKAEIIGKVYIKHGGDPFVLKLTPPPANLTDANPIYKWTITADEDCMPELNCGEFDLAPADGWGDGNCSEQWLEVSDGMFGKKRYCGRQGPKNIVVSDSNGLRDLYVTFYNETPKFTPYFECTARCGDKEKSKFLPLVMKPQIDPECKCGHKFIAQRDRIIGGHDTYKSEFPWLAAIVVAHTRQPYCIGSVINNKMILTAAHCFRGKFKKVENIQIVLNSYYMDSMPNINVVKPPIVFRKYDDETLRRLDARNNSFRFNVEKYWLHPLYNSNTSDFDTAVMLLSEPIDRKAFREYSPVCLPDLTYDVPHYNGYKAVIAGWGLPGTKAPGTNTVMKQISVNIFKPDFCVNIFGNRLVSTKRQLCAAYHDASEDSCAGDSGGPLIVQYRPQVWYQVGIISWGDGCALAQHPGIYYRTTSTNQWIRHISNTQNAVWCESPNNANLWYK